MIVRIFTQGGCYRLFEILNSIYPEAEPFYDEVLGHVYTRIDGRFYDIEGEFKGIAFSRFKRLGDLNLNHRNWHFDAFFLPIIGRLEETDLVSKMVKIEPQKKLEQNQ